VLASRTLDVEGMVINWGCVCCSGVWDVHENLDLHRHQLPLHFDDQVSRRAFCLSILI
jgi:hypothetical protein